MMSTASLLLLLFHLCQPSFQFSATTTLDNNPPPPSSNTFIDPTTQRHNSNDNKPPTPPPPLQLSGSWSKAKQSLQSPNCCVVSISGLDHHLSTLQTYFCGEDAPPDIDLRMRIRCIENNNHDDGSTDATSAHDGDDDDDRHSTNDVVYEDCSRVYTSIMDPPRFNTNNNVVNSNNNMDRSNPCIQALQELALGIHSLANHNNDRPIITDVHMRIVCASNYKAIDPPFHTDKCPLRGYVTLTGPGTEYMDVTCEPWEYVALRTLGMDGLSMVKKNRNNKEVGGDYGVKMAKELEFIVMKGDYYDDILPNEVDFDSSNNRSRSSSSIIKKKLWSRSEACVHRSPPGNNYAKRVILSLDLADGGDDQEWEERGRKRNWRVGMTQRKSHLVS